MRSLNLLILITLLGQAFGYVALEPRSPVQYPDRGMPEYQESNTLRITEDKTEIRGYMFLCKQGTTIFDLQDKMGMLTQYPTEECNRNTMQLFMPVYVIADKGLLLLSLPDEVAKEFDNKAIEEGNLEPQERRAVEVSTIAELLRNREVVYNQVEYFPNQEKRAKTLRGSFQEVLQELKNQGGQIQDTGAAIFKSVGGRWIKPVPFEALGTVLAKETGSEPTPWKIRASMKIQPFLIWVDQYTMDPTLRVQMGRYQIMNWVQYQRLMLERVEAVEADWVNINKEKSRTTI